MTEKDLLRMLDSGSSSSVNEALGTAAIVCGILALVGGIALYFTFLSPKNEKKFPGFLGWLYDFLSFKKLLVETILKIVYLITAGFITLYSLAVLFVGGGNFGENFFAFLMTLVIGNVIARVAYEFSLLFVLICRNVSDINKKLSGGDEAQPQITQQQKQTLFCSKCGKPFAENEVQCSACGKER